jgi:hypothetical protein
MATSPNRSTSTACQNNWRPTRKQGLPLRNRRKLSEQPGPPHAFRITMLSKVETKVDRKLPIWVRLLTKE